MANPDPLLEEGTRKAQEALGLSLTQLNQRLIDSTDEADKWLYGSVMEQKAGALAKQAAALPGPEEILSFTADLQNKGEVPDDYVSDVLRPIYRERTRQLAQQPLEVGKTIAATGEALGPVASDLLGAVKGVAKYAVPGVIGAVGSAMEDMGIGYATPEQKQAAELLGAAAEQGTRETARLAQRGARKFLGAVERGVYVPEGLVMSDKELDERFDSDLKYWRRQNLVERGERDVGALDALLFDQTSWNRRRDDIIEANVRRQEAGKEPLLVPPTWEQYSAQRKAERPKLTEEQVGLISPMGEVFDLTNYVGFGAGAKAVKAGGRVLAEKAIKTAAEEAAERVARDAAKVGAVRTAAGEAVEATGRALEAAAEKPVLRGVAAAAVTAAAGGEPVSATLAAIMGSSNLSRRLAKAGPEALEAAGKALKQPLPMPVEEFAKLAKNTGAGAAYGAAGMVPFAVAADSPEERGALLAGGLVFGGTGGGMASVLNSIGDFGKSYWSPTPEDPTAPRTRGTSYGTIYDAQHSKVAATLDNPTYNRVEGLRALIRPTSDLYVLSPQDYAALPVPGIQLSQGVNSIELPNGRKAVFVKLGGSALAHEVGEVVFESLPEAEQTKIIDAYMKAYPEDVREEMKNRYERKVGFALTPSRAAREVIAENFHAVLNGLPIVNLGVQPSFAKSLYGALGSTAERLGLRDMTPGQGVVTSEALEYTPSFMVRRALENALESLKITGESASPETAPAPVSTPAPAAPATVDVGTLAPAPAELATPTPAAPIAPAPGVDVGTLAPAPAELVPGAAPAPAAPQPQPQRPAVAGVTEQQRQTVAGNATPELQAANEAVLAANINKPIEVDYLSAVASEESGDAATRLRERQLADRNEQEGVPNPFREIYGKVVVPASVRTAGNGKRVFYGFSPDKLIRNIDQLRGWYLERGDKVSADRLYSQEFQKTVRTYLENQSNGYRGDGERIARPANTDPALYPAENPSYTPVKISEADRNLVNFLMGLDPVSPTSLAGAWVVKLAELNGFKPASFVPGRAGTQKPVYNPLTQQLRDAGFDGKLNSAIEQLRVERMVGLAKPRPDLSAIKPAVTGSTQAGFMPGGKTDEQMAAEMNAPGHRIVRGADYFVSGEPVLLQVYHASRRPRALIKSGGFNLKFLGETYGAVNDRLGWYFSSEYTPGDEGEYTGKKGEVLSFWIKLDNPLVLDDREVKVVEDRAGTNTAERMMEAGGHDGIIYVFANTPGDASVGEAVKARQFIKAQSVYSVQVEGVTNGPYRRMNRAGQARIERLDGLLRDVFSGKETLTPALLARLRPLLNIFPDKGVELTAALEEAMQKPPPAPGEGAVYGDYWVILPPETANRQAKVDEVTFDNRGRPIPPEKRFNWGKRDIRYMPEDRRLVNVGLNVGKSGVTGAREQAGLPRAFAYAEGSTLGQDAGLIDARKHYYEGVVAKGKIYDGVEDVLGYAEEPNRAKADQMLLDKGFIGIYREGLNGVKQLEFFQPMAVAEAAKPETTGPLAEEAMPILPPLDLEEIDYAAQDREFARKKAAGEPLYMPAPATPEQEAAFKNSKVRNEDGSLKPLFHFTTTAFDKFGRGDIGYHFGTPEQAQSRGAGTGAFLQWADGASAREGGRTIPVFLNIENPLRLRDVGSWDHPDDVLQALPLRVHASLPYSVDRAVKAFVQWSDEFNGPTAEFKAQRPERAADVLEQIRDGLVALGYDGIVYRNEFESKEQAEDSYIAFDNDQIMPALTKDAEARWMPEVDMATVKPLDAETAAAFMPAPRVDLEDYIGRDVVTLTTDRLDVGFKDVGPVGARKPTRKEAQGGRGFPLVYTGLGWAFSDPGSAKRFLTRLQATADGDTALVATAVLGEHNVLNSPFGQHAVAMAYRHAIEAGLLKQKDVDRSIRTIFARAAASTLGDPEMKKIKSLEDYEKASEKWPFSFGATRELAKRLDAAELKIPAELRQAIGLDALSLARSISDPELAGLPNFTLVSLMEIPVDQAPVKDDIHFSYPYTVKGKLLGFLKNPLAADKLISSSRVRVGGLLSAQPMMTVMPSLDLLKPSEINPDPRQALTEAKLEYAQ